MKVREIGYFTISAVIIAFFLLASGCKDNAKNGETQYKKAMVYIDESKEKEAIIELRNAIQIDPKFAEARYQLGLLYLKNGYPRQAFGEFQRVSTLDPNNLDAKIKTAEFYLLGQKHDEARNAIEGVLTKDPKNIDGLALLANLELIEGNTGPALENIIKAITLAPELDRLYIIQGKVLAETRQFKEAEASMIKALTLNGEKQANYTTLVSFYTSQQQYNKANEVLQAMATAFPQSSQPYLLMASLSMRKGEIDTAEQHLRKAMKIDPNNAGLIVSTGDFFNKQGKNDEAEKLYKQAIDLSDSPENIKAKLANFYFEQRRFDEAKQVIEAIFKTNPKNGGAKLVEAKFLLKDGQFNEALDITSQLSNKYPNWGEVYFVKAMAHNSLKESDLAKNAFLKTVEKNPSHAKARTMLALLFLREGDFAEAKKEAAIALKIDPKNFQAAMLLAKGVLFSKEFENAKRMLSELDSKVPNNTEILGNLGLAYLGLDQPEKAKETFEKIMAVQPGNAKAFTFLLKLSREAGQDKDTLITMTREQIDKAPDSAGLQILFANLMLSSNKPEEALKAYKLAQELDPHNPRPYTMSAMILNKQGKTAQAITEYEDLLAKKPDNIGAYMGLGAIYEQTGKTERAKENYRKVLNLNPNFAPAANNLAWLIAESTDPDLGEALRLAMIAKQELPDNANIIDTLGWVHFKRGSYTLARNEFEQAVEKDSNNTILRYHLALALHGEGKTDEAIEQMKQVVESQQEFKEKADAVEKLEKWQQS